MKKTRWLMAVALILGGAGSAAAQVNGSGTTNYIPRWTNSTTIGNSKIYQTGGNVGIGTTTPGFPLDVAGYINARDGYFLGGNMLFLTAPGGYYAWNTAVGDLALANGAGTYNTAVGGQAMEGKNSVTGSNNSAFGYAALFWLTSGNNNTAVGVSALAGQSPQTTGNDNTALGANALLNDTSGGNNIAIGYNAAQNVNGSGSDNIHIGSPGAAADWGAIRIGTSVVQTSFYVAGVRGVTTGSSDAVPVLIDSNGQLGTVNSSRRFKEDIQDMGDATQGLMRLRPVTFRYQKPFADGSKPIQYGLIAEEVAEVYPEMVAHSADGQVETVKYQMLEPMLLNEVQRQRAEIQGLQERLAKMEAALASLTGKPADASKETDSAQK